MVISVWFEWGKCTVVLFAPKERMASVEQRYDSNCLVKLPHCQIVISPCIVWYWALLHDILRYFQVLTCIDSVEMILNHWRDTDAGVIENAVIY